MFEEILHFWFEEIEPIQWWQKNDTFDQLIHQRFSEVHAQAAVCELYEWRHTAKGRLAEIIVLDQFSRNLFRDSARAFACDAMAVCLAQEAITVGAPKDLTQNECSFLYMPFMHSESKKVHRQAVGLFTQNGLESSLAFELKHKAIIDRFGRYPHRNRILGRESTAEELAFLSQPDSSF